jgi:uncharacterized protein RhaS with RHS repeats
VNRSRDFKGRKGPKGRKGRKVKRVSDPARLGESGRYDASEQFDWRHGQDGRYTEVQRDALHRITSVTYPAVSPWAAITVTTDYDEFGRVEQTTDANGTSTFAYDDLKPADLRHSGVGSRRQLHVHAVREDGKRRNWSC